MTRGPLVPNDLSKALTDAGIGTPQLAVRLGLNYHTAASLVAGTRVIPEARARQLAALTGLTAEQVKACGMKVDNRRVVHRLIREEGHSIRSFARDVLCCPSDSRGRDVNQRLGGYRPMTPKLRDALEAHFGQPIEALMLHDDQEA